MTRKTAAVERAWRMSLVRSPLKNAPKTRWGTDEAGEGRFALQADRNGRWLNIKRRDRTGQQPAAAAAAAGGPGEKLELANRGTKLRKRWEQVAPRSENGEAHYRVSHQRRANLKDDEDEPSRKPRRCGIVESGDATVVQLSSPSSLPPPFFVGVKAA